MTRRSPETVRFRDFFFCFRGGFTRRFSNTFLTLAGQQRGHFLGDGLLAGHVQVTIDIGGHLDITVAQPLLHVLERKAIAQQNAGTAMPQFVEADAGQAVLLEQAGKMMGDIVRRKRTAIRPFEHIRVLLVCLAEQAPVRALIRQGLQENGPGFRKQRERAVTAGVLGLILFHRLGHLADGVPNRQGAGLKVDAVPLQAQQFTAAQAVNIEYRESWPVLCG